MSPDLLATREPAYERRPMVAWFHPPQLVDTGLRAVLSSIFGTYADKRDTLAASSLPAVYDELAAREEAWIDYTADLGDGWDATYTMAWILSQPSLPVGGTDAPLPRGDALVLGGDQVYPTAKRDEYHHRFTGPYHAALPYVEETAGRRAPMLVALPGNHDWYDGLTSFTRLFGQQRWIGGRRTVQSRSYFALRLPHDWWLWGIDTQLHSDIDGPQLEYFRRVASGELEHGSSQPNYLAGHNVILCTPSPAWVAIREQGPEAYQNLAYVERTIIRPQGGKLRLTLTGDLHHYARYEGSGTPANRAAATPVIDHKITAGGGGAYLYGTHDLPQTLPLDAGGAAHELKASYPDPTASRRLARKAVGAFVFRTHNVGFTTFLALIYLLYAWMLQSTSKMLDTSPAGNQSFMEQVANLGLSDAGAVVRSWLGILAHGPAILTLTLLVVVGLVGFATVPRTWVRVVVGGLHGLVHVAVAVGATWAFAWVNLVWLNLDPDQLKQVVLFVIEMVLVGGVVGGLVMGGYLWLANRLLGVHINEVFSCQGIPHFKNFVRLHLDRDGALTVFPLKVPEVTSADDWVPRTVDPPVETAEGYRPPAATTTAETSWFQPRPECTPTASLIEDPLVLPGHLPD